MSLSTPAYALPDRPSRSLRTLRASGGARVGTVILVVVGICAMAPHLVAPFDPAEQRLLARFTPPLTRAADGTLAVLGTDQLGRDILSRLIYGARTSSLIGPLAVRARPYVEAARSLGLPVPRIVLRHILPNVSASLMVVATFGIAGAILTEAGLSFLGLGVPVAIPSWGGMLAEGRQYVDTRSWLALFPAAAPFMTVMAINLVGDTLRDTLDPYLYARRSLEQL